MLSQLNCVIKVIDVVQVKFKVFQECYFLREHRNSFFFEHFASSKSSLFEIQENDIKMFMTNFKHSIFIILCMSILFLKRWPM